MFWRKILLLSFYFIAVFHFNCIPIIAQTMIEYMPELYGERSIERRTIRELNENKPFAQQLSRKNTKYVIKHKYNLNGQTVSVPSNSVLCFEGGCLENGSLSGDYYIVSTPRRIFINVQLHDFQTHGVDIRWFIGEERYLTSELLNNLPNVPIFFGDKTYYTDEEIILNGVDFVEYHNLNLFHSKSIKAFSRSIAGGLGNMKQNDFENHCEYISPFEMRLSRNISRDYENKIICVRTADRTLQGWRPLTSETSTNLKGNPTLFKGLTSVIRKVKGDFVEVSDTIGAFSRQRSYSYEEDKIIHVNEPILSTWVILQPKHIEFYNCSFIGTEKDASVFVGGKDIIIEGCSFISRKGTEVVLSINNTHGGFIHNCTVEGAWAGDNNNTNYGIQVNCSTSILIDSCFFRNNRRGVDFSGEYESRYCSVSNSVIIGDSNYYKSGSALGGHSTSYGNSYRNNIIEGRFQVGIVCRGENELVEGNKINAFCNGAIFVSSYNTIFRNNEAHNSKWGKNHKAFYIGNEYDFESTVVIEGNNIDIRERYIHSYNPLTTLLIVRNNTINCYLDSPTDKIRIAPDGFRGDYSNNTIQIHGYLKRVFDIPKDE